MRVMSFLNLILREKELEIMLKENLAKVEENIQAACDRAGRK